MDKPIETDAEYDERVTDELTSLIHKLSETYGMSYLLSAIVRVYSDHVDHCPTEHPHHALWVTSLELTKKYVDDINLIYESASKLPADK